MDDRSKTDGLLTSFLSSYSRARRLDDRIRSLCAQAVEVNDPEKLTPILGELSAALRDHTARIRKLAAARPSLPDRRASTSS